MNFEKEELRKKIRKIRSRLTPYQRKIKSREITRLFFSNIKIPKTYIISGYIPLQSEVDISMLLDLYRDNGNKICLPCVAEKNSPMIFREYKKNDVLVKNSNFGFLEPSKGEELIPDLIITPLIAFDYSLNRLGQGGGYYDRTFECISGFKDFMAVGVGFSCQQVDYLKPEKYDYKLDAVVTEKRFII